MNPTATDRSYPNGYRETTGIGASEPYTGAGPTYPSTTDKPAAKSYAGQQEGGEAKATNLDSIANFAKAIQTKVKGVPYIVPIAIGGAAFTLGVLASSKILRQLTLLAGAYAMRYALQNAPKDQIMGFAKEVIVNTFKQAQRA
jgi:hypothetical protein